MSKNRSYLLTQSRLSSLIRHLRKGKDLSVCAVCHERLKELDYVIRDGHNIMHSTCWPLFRCDSPDEDMEQWVDSQIVENPSLKSQRDVEAEQRLLKLRNRKEPKIL